VKIFFDTEFTGLHKNTTLISIGLVSELGNSFYAELTDYDELQIDNWLKNNIINNLSKNEEDLKTFADHTIKGNSVNVAKVLLNWLDQFDTIEWYSDVSHYDFVLLIDLLFGNALNMKKGCSAVCHDINQDIATYLSITETEAFDMSREKILKRSNISIKGNKHNSIYDAFVIKAIYKLIY